MIYRAIGLMSGSSLDGLDICYAHLQEVSGKWTYEIQKADCYEYSPEWVEKLKSAVDLSARDYMLLHAHYGRYTGELVNRFIHEHQLEFQVQLIGSHGHTSFHIPQQRMTAQLGDGSAIASVTGVNTVSDLRSIDVALGGQGAPIVPIGEKMLLGNFEFFLNLGGIANLSYNPASVVEPYLAFDVCPANRVLNLLANQEGKDYDAGGQLAASGTIDQQLLNELNSLVYYHEPYPKSLANEFGTEVLYPQIKKSKINTADGLRTMVEHIVIQIGNALQQLKSGSSLNDRSRMLVTGGGAFNDFVIERLMAICGPLEVEVVKPEENLIKYKEALIMAFIGLLRWREENNIMASVTGAERNSIGGAVWMGQEA